MVPASFAGFGLGVAVAFPLYVRHRWPDAFTGRAAATGPLRTVALFAAAFAAVMVLLQLYWSLGGTVGLNPATLSSRDTQWHLLIGNTGVWSLIAAWSVWRGVPLLSWVASGFLFAWGSWKAILSFAVVTDFPPPEPLWLLAAFNHFAALAGLAILITVVTAGHTGRGDQQR